MAIEINFLIFSLLTILLTSCSGPNPNSELEAKCESLMEKYPNYESNDIAYQAINDSISTYCESFVEKEASLLKGIEYDFIEIFDNKNTGNHAALFRGRAFCEIEVKGGKTKYIISSPQVIVGAISEEQLATLDNNQKCSISGVVHAWDGKNILVRWSHDSCRFVFRYVHT